MIAFGQPWSSERPYALPMTRIAGQVAARHGLTLAELRGPETARRFAHPRQEAMWEIWKTERFSLILIGRFFGRRDHTTVRHAVRAHNARQRGEKLSRAA